SQHSGIAAALAEAAADDETRRPRGGLEKPLWPRLRRVLKWSLLLAGVAGLVGATAIVVTIRRLEADLPSVQQLRAGYQPPQVTRILASDGTLLGNVFVERRTVVNVDAIPSHAK